MFSSSGSCSKNAEADHIQERMRRRIDVLQSKIKFLEEAMANTAKVTRAPIRIISLHLERFVLGEMHG